MSSSIDKVRKLLNLAGNHAATEGEIKAAMAQAERLMAKHHLTEDDLAHGPEDDYAAVDAAEFADYRVFVGRRFAEWEKSLGQFVSEFVGCPWYLDGNLKPVRNHGILQLDDDDRPLRGKSLVYYGVADDAVTQPAATLLESREGVEAAYRDAAKRYHPDAGGDATAFSRVTAAVEILRGYHQRRITS